MLKLLDGSRRWEPNRVDLAGFLFGVIRSDVANEIDGLTKRQDYSLDNEGLDLDDLERETSFLDDDETCRAQPRSLGHGR